MAVVIDSDEVAGIAAAIARAPLVAFDVEFMSADRLVPVLCLIQVAWLEEHVSLDAPAQTIVATPEVRIVDPIATDAGPVVRALATHPLVVAHAPRQDLALLATRFGTAMTGIVDTQLMAAFCGLGDQIGLASLVKELVGVSLAKEMQWTAWDRRPLSDAQLGYADADVRHLPAVFAKLAARLGPRLAWAREESAQLVVDALAATSVTPETAWQHVGGVRGLDPAAHAAVVALAEWRQRAAIELNRPLGQVLADKLLVELARQRPSSANAVRSAKGLSPLARARADDVVAAIATARTVTSGDRTIGSGGRTFTTRAQRWAETLLSIVQLVAEDTAIAPRLLATRADAEEFARTVDEHGLAAADTLPALATWRRDVVGLAWQGWLDGRLAIVGDASVPAGVRLLPRSL